MNRNPWWRVAGRKAVRFVLRQFARLDTPWHRRLEKERMRIAMSYPDRPLPDADRERLARVNWLIGTGSAYRD